MAENGGPKCANGGEPSDFRTSVHLAFPDRSSARAARFAEVGQRTMQKWMSGENVVPNVVFEMIDHQGRIVHETHLQERLDGVARDFLGAEGHPEALGSALSALYKRVLGKPIE